jgi:hypothetical protein
MSVSLLWRCMLATLVSSLAYSSTLNIEAMSVDFQRTTRHYIPHLR